MPPAGDASRTYVDPVEVAETIAKLEARLATVEALAAKHEARIAELEKKPKK